MLQAAIPLVAKYAVPALATTGALFGGKQAYEQSGGDLGATALGAGLGAAGMGALPAVGRRMAGSKMGQDVSRKLVESGAAGKAGQAVDVLSGKGPLASNPLQQQMLGQQALGVLGTAGLGAAGLYAVPRLAGGLAGGTKNLTSNVLGGAKNVASTGMAIRTAIDPTTGEVVYTQPAVPSNLPTPDGLAQVFSLTGPYTTQLLHEKRLQDLALRGVKEASAYQLPIVDEIKQRDFSREMAARKLATDLQTAQTMMMQGQLGAQQMASQTLGDIGAAARTQYRYL